MCLTEYSDEKTFDLKTESLDAIVLAMRRFAIYCMAFVIGDSEALRKIRERIAQTLGWEHL